MFNHNQISLFYICIDGLYSQLKMFLSLTSLFMKFAMKRIEMQIIHIYIKTLLEYMLLHSFLNEGH